MSENNFLIIYVKRRRDNRSLNHINGIFEIVQVVRTVRTICECICSGLYTSSGTSCSLCIVSGRGRHISHKDSFQRTNINTHLKRCRTAQHIDMLIFEIVLISVCFLRTKLCRVLLCNHIRHIEMTINVMIVIVFQRILKVIFRQMTITLRIATSAIKIEWRYHLTLVTFIKLFNGSNRNSIC